MTSRSKIGLDLQRVVKYESGSKIGLDLLRVRVCAFGGLRLTCVFMLLKLERHSLFIFLKVPN